LWTFGGVRIVEFLVILDKVSGGFFVFAGQFRGMCPEMGHGILLPNAFLLPHKVHIPISFEVADVRS
jgi:hypothetical protein